eukprot:PhF_6_TR11560/c0_g1_i1/m.18625
MSELQQFLLNSAQGFHYEWTVAVLGDRKCGKSSLIHALLNNTSAADSTPLHAIRLRYNRPHHPNSEDTLYCQMRFEELCCRDVGWQPIARTCTTALLVATSRYQWSHTLKSLHTSGVLKTMHSIIVAVVESLECDLDNATIENAPNLPRDITIIRVDLLSPASVALLRSTLVSVVVSTFHSSLEPALLPKGVVLGSLVLQNQKVLDEYAGKLGAPPAM